MPAEGLSHARILIVDDQAANVLLLERTLRIEGYLDLKSTTDARDVLRLRDEFRPDLILLDLHMPHLSGFEVMDQLRARADHDYVPVLILTADATPASRQRALSAGAKDFLAKPFDRIEAGLRVRNLLETRFLYLALQKQNETLEQKVQERTQELETAKLEVLERLAKAAEYRDDATGRHTQRVGDLAGEISRLLGLPEDQVQLIQRAAALHDVGKIGIPDSILLKPGKLDPGEFENMKAHTAIGAGILGGSCFPLLQLAEEIAYYHHERWDGTGYNGVAGEAIPLAARIVALADVFDVLIHERPYKNAWTVEDALAEIRCQSGRQFDPAIVDLFLRARARHDVSSLALALNPLPSADTAEPRLSDWTVSRTSSMMTETTVSE